MRRRANRGKKGSRQETPRKPQKALGMKIQHRRPFGPQRQDPTQEAPRRQNLIQEAPGGQKPGPGVGKETHFLDPGRVEGQGDQNQMYERSTENNLF